MALGSSMLNSKNKCGATAYPSITNQEFCPQVCTIPFIEDDSLCDVPESPEKPAYQYRPTMVRSHMGRSDTGSWKQILPQRFLENTAPFKQLCTAFLKSGNKQLFMSGKDAGATMHFHAAAYNALFFGWKKWVLLPQRYAELSGMPVADFYSDAQERKLRAYSCTQRAGDLLLLPRLNGHATINPYGFAIGVGNLYIDAHSESTLVAHNSKADDDHSYNESWFAHTFQEKPMRGYASRVGRVRGGAKVASLMAPERGSEDELLKMEKFERRMSKRLGKRDKFIKKPEKVEVTLANLHTIDAGNALARHPLASKEAVVDVALRKSRRSDRCDRDVTFVHINKAGGTAMLENLKTCCSDRLLKTHHQSKLRDKGYPRNFFFHGNAQRQHSLVGEDAWKDAFKFALVRNPWARQVSMFHFLVGGQCGKETKKDRCKERFIPMAGAWEKDPELAIPAFRKWMKDLDDNYPPSHPKNYLFGSMAHGNDENAWFNASQLSWLVDERGQVLVDKVIKLEELTAEWKGLMHDLCADDKLEASHANPSVHTHYSEYYDEVTKDVVDRHMAPDVAYFGYKFERRTS
jgi:hypothetical protein